MQSYMPASQVKDEGDLVWTEFIDVHSGDAFYREDSVARAWSTWENTQSRQVGGE